MLYSKTFKGKTTVFFTCKTLRTFLHAWLTCVGSTQVRVTRCTRTTKSTQLAWGPRRLGLHAWNKWYSYGITLLTLLLQTVFKLQNNSKHLKDMLLKWRCMHVHPHLRARRLRVLLMHIVYKVHIQGVITNRLHEWPCSIKVFLLWVVGPQS